MPREIFIIPVVDVGPSGIGTGRAYEIKYIQNGDIFPNTNRVEITKYSKESVAMVAIDADQTYLDTVGGNFDVVRVANGSNLDTTINATQRDNIRGILNNLEIPGQWVNTGDSRRELVRGLKNLFRFAQRVEELTGKFIKPAFQDEGVTLNTQWNLLPPFFQTMFQTMAAERNIDTGQFSGTTQMRQVMRVFSQSWESTPINILGIDL